MRAIAVIAVVLCICTLSVDALYPNYVVFNFGSGGTAMNLYVREAAKHEKAQSKFTFSLLDFRAPSEINSQYVASVLKDRDAPGQTIAWLQREPPQKPIRATTAEEGRALAKNPATPANTVVYWAKGSEFDYLVAGTSDPESFFETMSDLDSVVEGAAPVSTKAGVKFVSRSVMGEASMKDAKEAPDMKSVQALVYEQHKALIRTLTPASAVYIIGHSDKGKLAISGDTRGMGRTAEQIANLIAENAPQLKDAPGTDKLKVSVLGCFTGFEADGKPGPKSFAGELSNLLARRGIRARVTGRLGIVSRSPPKNPTALVVKVDRQDGLGGRSRITGSKVYFDTDPKDPNFKVGQQIAVYEDDPPVLVLEVADATAAAKALAGADVLLGSVAIWPKDNKFFVLTKLLKERKPAEMDEMEKEILLSTFMSQDPRVKVPQKAAAGALQPDVKK